MELAGYCDTARDEALKDYVSKKMLEKATSASTSLQDVLKEAQAILAEEECKKTTLKRVLDSIPGIQENATSSNKALGETISEAAADNKREANLGGA